MDKISFSFPKTFCIHADATRREEFVGNYSVPGIIKSVQGSNAKSQNFQTISCQKLNFPDQKRT